MVLCLFLILVDSFFAFSWGGWHLFSWLGCHFPDLVDTFPEKVDIFTKKTKPLPWFRGLPTGGVRRRGSRNATPYCPTRLGKIQASLILRSLLLSVPLQRSAEKTQVPTACGGYGLFPCCLIYSLVNHSVEKIFHFFWKKVGKTFEMRNRRVVSL